MGTQHHGRCLLCRQFPLLGDLDIAGRVSGVDHCGAIPAAIKPHCWDIRIGFPVVEFLLSKLL